MVGDTHYHCGDTLVEQGHGRGAMDEVGKRLDQLLPKTRLQGGQCPKLGGKAKIMKIEG